MPASVPTSNIHIGYLTFVEFSTHGIVGGYLIVNRYARPVEFHCTAPVCPSRAQEILYGPTLRSFLIGDHLGKALLSQPKIVPNLTFTDEILALQCRQVTTVPIVFLQQSPQRVAAIDFDSRSDVVSTHASDPGGTEIRKFVLRQYEADTAPGFDSDRQVAEKLVCGLPDWELAEPLDRIREAIGEAQRAAA